MRYYANTTNEITEQEKKHGALARSLAGECVTLLENDGTLPLAAGERIALYGSGARETVKGGTGSGDVNSREIVNVEQGLTEAGFVITTDAWLDRFEEEWKRQRKEHQAWVEKTAKEQGVPVFAIEFSNPLKEPVLLPITEVDTSCDTAMLVITRRCGEGVDRKAVEGDYYFYPKELEAIRYLAKTYARFVLVLNIGNTMELTPLREIAGINAIVLMNQLGNMGGAVLADIVSGRVNPSGRLVDTWAKAYRDYPSSAEFGENNGDKDDAFYTEGIYVGYRYFDTFGVEPLYPFGYGLSYTEFERKLEEPRLVDNTEVELAVSVRNIGDRYAGKEVVQVYVTKPYGRCGNPTQVLAGYAKTGLLAPGEEELVRVQIPLDRLTSYMEKEAAWILERGEYIFRVGRHSRDTVPALVLAVQEDQVVTQCRNACPLDLPMQELQPGYVLDLEFLDGVPELTLAEYGKPCQKVSYDLDRAGVKPEMKALLQDLSVAQLAELCVGTYRKEGEPSIIGNASVSVPGAAGETSPLLEEKGYPALILADGPAGLRLEKEFEREGQQYYQYCTAIPIAWALAHSWNGALIEQVGDMIGEEMENFHVDLWLAPALNIHRNPLCGRNFEYYSEDPLISGSVAAAITRGVQKHKGCGTTIKHFAANNQETNRFFNNSHVGERALREIYLKGFEIAVKEAKPLAIMTSYNLLNGTHTANRRDLLQDICRMEWGYEGMIMTDWNTSVDVPEITLTTSSKYPIASSVGCVYAGNDVQMPGCSKNVTDLIEAVEENREIDGYHITREDLEYCAARVLGVGK